MTERWLLAGGVGPEVGGDDEVVGRCAEIDGLFADLSPRQRERFTLIGCEPAAAFAAHEGWLGALSLVADEMSGVDLGDVAVLARRPSATVPGAEDVDLDGFVRGYDRTDAVWRPRDATAFELRGWDGPSLGTCRDVTGVFREAAPPPVPQVRLLGCRPAPPLLAAMKDVGRTSHAAERRRFVSAAAHQIADDGSAHPVIGAGVYGTIQAVQPSRLGAGLIDVTVASVAGEPLPAGVLGILDRWRSGRPAEPNAWAGYDRELRHHWAGVTLGHRVPGPDRRAGATYELDGRFVTDIEGFWCAMGEAVNGPGGYFGWNLGALADCLRGGFGARTPFRLVWHDAAVAREHLVAGYDRRLLMPAITLDDLLQLLTAEGVEVVPR